MGQLSGLPGGVPSHVATLLELVCIFFGHFRGCSLSHTATRLESAVSLSRQQGDNIFTHSHLGVLETRWQRLPVCHCSDFPNISHVRNAGVTQSDGASFSQKISSFQSFLDAGLQHIRCCSWIQLVWSGRLSLRNESKNESKKVSSCCFVVLFVVWGQRVVAQSVGTWFGNRRVV